MTRKPQRPAHDHVATAGRETDPHHATPALDTLCEALGIVCRYTDGAGRAVQAPPETRRALAAALGYPATTEAEATTRLAEHRRATKARGGLAPFYVVDEGEAVGSPPPLPRGAELWLEDGTTGDPARPIPRGLHRVVLGEASAPLIVAPRQLALPDRAWGVTLPLHGLWDGMPEGIGDYALLGRAAEGFGQLGAAFLGVNPVHAGFWQDRTSISPYSPSHRGRLDVRPIALPQAAVAPGQASGQTPEQAPGRAPDPDLIDYAREIPARADALRAAFAEWRRGCDPDFEPWRTSEGEDLERFARHEALADHFGTRWPQWPAAYQRPDSPAVEHFARKHADAVTFHAWAQWMAHRQLSAAQQRARGAGMRMGLYLDLAVGTRPDGAECWADPGLHAQGVSLGAPPDAFAPNGQCWDLAPLHPGALLARGLRPFAQILRAQLRYAGLLRIDHILGFARAFWIPDGLPGAYVTMPSAALLAVARLEAARAGAAMVGEDLGVIPEGLRADLTASGILGCRVMMFETDAGAFIPPDRYPEAVLASFTTHDLPTVAGWCTGRDLFWWEQIGTLEAETARKAHEQRETQARALEASAGGTEATTVHRWLASTPARLVAVQAEDLLGCTEQANLPGTTHAHPNWRRRLPAPVSALGATPGALATANAMADAGRGPRFGSSQSDPEPEA
jgi:4-alpha-glucanotransferase